MCVNATQRVYLYIDAHTIFLLKFTYSIITISSMDKQLFIVDLYELT